MLIQILGICGSPRNANSYFMLEDALRESDVVKGTDTIAQEIYAFEGKKIGPCISCYKCWEDGSDGTCILRDDFEELKEKWLAADVVIYSVPVYHLSVPAQVKCFWDRLGNSMYKKFSKPSCRHLKTVGCLTQGMHIHSGHELTIQSVIMHAMLMKCFPVAGDGWHSYTGAAAWTALKEDRNALKSLYDNPDEVNDCGMKAARSVVRRCMTLARILKHGGGALKGELSEDERFFPFLSRLEKTDQ